MGKIENFKDKVNTVGFSQMPENICKSGRPKKIYTVLSEQGYSKDDIRTAFGELGWYTLKQLEVVHSDNKKPLIVRIIANQFIIAFEKGDFLKVKEIIEYVVGKPKQHTQVTGDFRTTKADLQAIFPTDEELEEMTDKRLDTVIADVKNISNE